MKKFSFKRVGVGVIIVVGFYFLFGFFVLYAFPENRKVMVHIGDNKFEALMASTVEEQVKGLSGRKSLKKKQGMLFIFQEARVASFWMKDMNFDLDIIWINDNEVVNISKNLKAEGENPENTYSSNKLVDNVFEINAGLSDELGIEVGDRVDYYFK